VARGGGGSVEVVHPADAKAQIAEAQKRSVPNHRRFPSHAQLMVQSIIECSVECTCADDTLLTRAGLPEPTCRVPHRFLRRVFPNSFTSGSVSSTNLTTTHPTSRERSRPPTFIQQQSHCGTYGTERDASNTQWTDAFQPGFLCIRCSSPGPGNKVPSCSVL
jgi:hypothetical protein